MKVFLGSLLFALAAMKLLSPSFARAQADFSGVWTLNSAASDLGGMRPPRSDVITMEQRGTAFAWSEVIVTPSAKVEKEAWSGALDGVARPVIGPPGAMASYKADGTGRWMSPEGNSDLLARVSADGKQFILTSTSKLPDGRSMTQKFVYDRTFSGQTGTEARAVSATPASCTMVDPGPQDGVVVAPENHKVLYETADVRVIEVTLSPHSKETIHTHLRPSVFYLDGAAPTRYVVQGDEAHPVVQQPPPERMMPLVLSFKPEPLHSVENLGDVPFHALRVEMKHPGCTPSAGGAAAAPGANDAVRVAPDNYKVLLETEDVRVIDVHIAPHAREPMHTHPWGGFIYVLQAEPLRDYAADGTAGPTRNMPAGGKVLPAKAAGLHATENLGDATLHAVRFELKHMTPPP